MPWSQTEISELLIAHRARGAICEDLRKKNARLQAKNEMLQSKLDWALSLLENREVNIKNLTSLLDAIPCRHSERCEGLENLAYLRDNFIDQRMDYYSHFHMSEEEARESAEEDALEHFPAALAVSQ